MSSLPTPEELRTDQGSSPTSTRKTLCRKLFFPCCGCAMVLALILGLTIHFTGKRASQLAADASSLAKGMEDTYDAVFGDGSNKRADPTEEDRGTITLTSSAFEYGETIPERYTSDGADVSPPLKWENLPEGTESLMVLVEDHDYPSPDRPDPKPWLHWACYDINPELSGLPEDVGRDVVVAKLEDPSTGEDTPAGADEDELYQGATSWTEDAGYRGPDPPARQTHRYYFRVLALDSTLADELEVAGKDPEREGDVTYDDLLSIVEGDDPEVEVLGFGLLMGTYAKS